MRYSTGAEVGPDGRYKVRSVPAALAARAGAGSYLHRAEDTLCHGRGVTLRTVRYTNVERSSRDEGYRAGRARLTRTADLLNRVDAVVFPEVLDRFEDRDVAEPFEDPELARSEPVLVFQHLAGDDLESLLSQRYFAPRNGDEPVHRIHVPRVARMLRKVALLAQGLLAGGVAHVDLSPQHVLLMTSDEVPRLLGPGHLVALVDGRVADGDPSLRFTSAGFAAPELVTDVWDWGRGALGEAVMLYGLGATMLSILLGGSASLTERGLAAGPSGALALAAETRETLAVDQAPHALSRVRFVDLAAQLLALDPNDRLAANTLETLPATFELLAGDRVAEALVDLACARCNTAFRGDPERHAFDYAGVTFTLCRACHKAARERVQRTAPRCGCAYEERAGDEWARGKVGHVPRQWCKQHKPVRGGW